MNNYKELGLKEGTFVSLIGMEVKNENDIYIIDRDYNIPNEYYSCKNQFSLRKVKLNGEVANTKYGLLCLNERIAEQNPNAIVKVITDLKQGKKEVKQYLKERESGEIVTTFKISENQELQHLSIIRFKEGLKFGTFGEKYISKDSLYLVKVRENKTIYITELGKKGQSISNARMFGCTMGLTNKIAEVSEIVEIVEIKKGDIEKVIAPIVEEVQENKTEIMKEVEKVEELNKYKCNFGYCKEYKEGKDCKKCSEVSKSQGYTGCVFATSKENIEIILKSKEFATDSAKEEIKEESKQNNIFKITSKQWEKTSKDYKSIRNGQKYIMKDMSSIPVEIDDINGQELRSYNFEECYMTYSVLAWSFEDAERIIKDSGHCLRLVKNLRLKEIETEVKQEVKETIIEESKTESPAEQEENPTTTETNDNNESELNVTVSYNEEKNGIEVRFSEKPNKEILSQLSHNGFRYSKFQKMWYTKDSAEKREFLKSIGFISSQENNNTNESNEIQLEVSEVKEFSYSEININDIENYTISEELSKRENDGHWVFRTKERNHQKEIQSYLQQCNNSVMEIIENTENQQIIYYAKKWLQSYKKRYYNNYVSRLSNQANNPSIWTTGRGGRDVNKYNNRLSKYDKLMKECCELQDEFESKLHTIKNKIYTEKKQAKKEKIEKILNEQGETITPIKTKKLINASAVENIFDNPNTETTVYNYNEFDILKNWGYWRIYKNGQEVSEKCNSLTTAKKLLAYLVAETQII